MNVATDDLSPAQVLARARAWYENQCERLAKFHGTKWPERQAWCEAYLREELRLRLIERGWRSRL